MSANTAGAGRLTRRFAALAEARRSALIPFVTAGDPSVAGTVALLHRLVAAGADAIELGVPFSDPMADGPTIQRSSERALARGMTLRGVLEQVREFRRRDSDTPLILMGYLNPIEAMGVGIFAQSAKEAGVDGVIVVDLTPEEADETVGILDGVGIAPIFLLAPTSGADRVDRVAQLGRGFVYYVSLRGITGAQQADWDSVLVRVRQIREKVGLPVAIGFGIRDADTARALAQGGADAVVIGSALVEKLAGADSDGEAADRAEAFLQPIAAALQGEQGR